MTADYFVVPKGAPNKQARGVHRRATCANNNAAVSNKIPYGPTNKNSKPNESVVADLAVHERRREHGVFQRRPRRRLDAIDAPFQAWVTQ